MDIEETLAAYESDWSSMHLEYRRRIGTFVLNRLTEVTNEIGGVTGYRLNLNAEETEKLIREIES